MKRALFILTLMLCLPVGAQQSPFRIREAQKALVERLTAFGKAIPQEKVYVHMDNTCYFQGDTIWFAAYLRKTSTDTPSDVSGVLYVELLNNDGYLVERKLVEMQGGRGEGFFALNNQIQYSGFYELRAYTRWQLNWGQFEHWYSQAASNWFGDDKEREKLFFRDYEKLYSRVFPVYDQPKEKGDYTREMTMRVMQRTFKDDPDAPTPMLTLFPEGGNLIAGIPNRVAFEAVMSDGEWLEGSLTCSEGKDSAKAISRGRGMFTITPEAGKTYEVTFTTIEGKSVKAKLPKPEEQGVAIQVRQEGDSVCIETRLAGLSTDSLALTIMHEGRVSEFKTLNDPVIQSDGKNLEDPSGRYARLWMTAKSLRCGVNQVTVFDTQGRVYADRLFFVTKQEEMQPTLIISANKEQYAPYEAIELDIKGKATETPISLAVRDKAHQDYLFDNADIMTEMLLSSEIRGFVPDPGWFFEENDEEHRTALDLLMMTQGWRRFNWRDMAVKGEWDLTEPDERTPIIKGKIYKATAEQDSLYEKEQDANLQAIKGMELYAKKESAEAAHIKEKSTVDEARQRSFIQKATEENAPALKYELQQTEHLRKGKSLVVHAELTHTEDGTTVAEEVETKDRLFRFQLPRFHGRSLFFLSAADTTKWKADTPYYWVQEILKDDDELISVTNVEDADYSVIVFWPYPHFVKPYTFHQIHLSASSNSPGIPPELLADGSRLLKEVPVRARRNMWLRFDDSYPVLCIDAYEAENIQRDAGCNFIRTIVKDYGLERPYVSTEEGQNDSRILFISGLSPLRRTLPPYIDIPPDSIYAKKYLKSFNGLTMSPRELKYYKLNYLDRIYVYTDFSPRLEGSKRYQGSNLPETRVVSYPYYDGSRRAVYRDRRYMLDGFAYPAEFYSPDYSKQKPTEPTDYRRTLYWNPNLKLDEEGRARVTLFNNSRTTQIQVEAAGQAQDGTLLWNGPSPALPEEGVKK